MFWKKKFKTRTVYLGRNKYYYIQYTSYRFIPYWITLCRWHSYGYTDNLESWVAFLTTREHAESIAKSLTSLEKVRAWYIPEETQEKQFRIEQKEYYKSLDIKGKTFKH